MVVVILAPDGWLSHKKPTRRRGEGLERYIPAVAVSGGRLCA